MTKTKTNKTNSTLTSNRVPNTRNPGNVGITTRNRGPVIRATRNGMVVRNQELYTTLNGMSTAQYVAGAGINPSDSSIMPWLSNIAKVHSLYRWKKLRVLYQSNCATTMNGDVVIGLFYDRADIDAFMSTTTPGDRRTQLTQTVGASVGPVYGSNIYSNSNGSTADIMVEADVVRLHSRVPWLVCEQASIALENQSVGVYYGAVVGNNGYANNVPVGRLWFDYEVEFIHPTPNFLPPPPPLEVGGRRSVIIMPDPTPFPPLPPPPAPPKPPKPDETIDVNDDQGS